MLNSASKPTKPQQPSKLGAYARLLRWHQPAGFYLILPPTLWGLAAALDYPGLASSPATLALLLSYAVERAGDWALSPLWLAAVFSAGALIMRSAGCIINDLWDRHLDPRVARTRSRPLASGELTKTEALWLFAGLLGVALLLLLLLNTATFLLAGVGLLGTLFYPLAKRVMQVPQLILGLVFSWGTLMAWTAVAGSLWYWQPWLFWLANVLWIISYDLQYALCDAEDDKQVGINSGAIYFGGKTPGVIVLLQTGALLLLAAAGLTMAAGLVFYLSLIGSGLLFIMLWEYTQGYTDKSACLASFKRNHLVGWLVLAGLMENVI